MDVRELYFNKNIDKYGSLVPLEENKEIPFKIRRVYYIYNVEQGVRRGFHSHYDLEQVLICVSGSVKILVKTPYEEKVILLNSPQKGLYIGSMIWREMFEFSTDAVLLVLASDLYKPEDYIREYEKYENIALKQIGEEK